MSESVSPKGQKAQEWRAAALKNVSFAYFQILPWSGGEGYITAAFRSCDKGVNVAFSFCSPSEGHFIKKKGREMAASRLYSGNRREKTTGRHKQAAWYYDPKNAPEHCGPEVAAVSHVFNNLVPKSDKPGWLKGITLRPFGAEMFDPGHKCPVKDMAVVGDSSLY